MALLLSAAVLACAGPDSPTPTPTPASAASSTPEASGAFGPGEGHRAGLVDIGDGRDMYLECSGTGAPTVVFISGAGVAADNWRYADLASVEPDDSAVYSQTARFTRVCAYDRPGTQQWQGAPSRSTTVPQPTTAQGDAADLHALLKASDVAGPYVIVGHSWGGLIATTFARTYPAEVSGIVLVDPGSQFLQTVLPQDVWAQWMQLIAETGFEHPDLESPDYPSSIAALEATSPLPAIPAVVMSADTPFDYLGIGDAQAYWPEWLEAHAQLAASIGATHITQTHSGHFVENENAALVLEQICSVVRPPGGC
ncbi:MAG TPA: alpha/beta hydrolase [Agromyces sp.]|nr:alpha/beta hydrolase [Agromyces sp.]